MNSGAPWRGRTYATSHRYPIAAVALLVAILVLPMAMTRGTADVAASRAAPQGQATPGPVIAAPGQDQSGIFLNNFDCPGTYGGDLSQLLQNCTVVLNVDFEVLGPNLQETAHGGISMQAMPAGLYRIREFIPAGYGDPIAFCGFAPSNDQQPALSPIVVYGGYYEFQLGQNESIYCDWFNIQPGAPADQATLYTNKHFCPAVAEFDAYAASIYDLAATCHEPTPPVPFTVTRNGATIASGTTSSGPLVFNGLQPGPISVVETLPEGYDVPIVFCSVKDGLGNSRAPTLPVTVDNDRISWQLNPADVVFCDWYNVPAPLGVSISAVKYACPDSVGYDRDDFDDYAAACTEPVADVSFKLDGASTGNPGDRPTDSNGQVTWSEMEADHYFLSEEVPTGYGLPVVFCSYYLPAALQDRVWLPYPVSSENRIEFDVMDGQFIACSWFNVSEQFADTAPIGTPGATPVGAPDATPGIAPDTTPGSRARTTTTGRTTSGSTTTTLTIRAFRCEPGYDDLSTDADPVLDCPTRPDDVSFELATIAGASNQAPRRADTAGPVVGEATFTGVVAGAYRLTELDIPSGGTAFILSCQSNQRTFGDYPLAPFGIVAVDGSVRLSLVAGESLACDWYDVPPDAANVGLTVQVFDCGSAQPSVDACEPATERARFVLAPVSGNGSLVSFETGETGTAHVNDLDGIYTLSQVGRQPCAVQSTGADANGNLAISLDRLTEVNVFNCG